ncbi:MAG TPA: CsbD family protein [Candidatus Acidoferrales bacterium]|jgi:uncharacterized protein YjbJ (UPF0337 family)|nr:CsbD family protein [Candidatus Acidoferrales bacterium]
MPKESTRDEVKGKAHEIKGKVKQKVAEITNNPRLGEEGEDEELGGTVQKKAGQVKKVFGK